MKCEANFVSNFEREKNALFLDTFPHNVVFVLLFFFSVSDEYNNNDNGVNQKKKKKRRRERDFFGEKKKKKREEEERERCFCINNIIAYRYAYKKHPLRDDFISRRWQQR